MVEQRQEEYEDYYYENINKSESIFQLLGINVIDFTHEKIKFSFTPKKVVHYISSKVVFYCSTRYRNGYWMIMRNTLPVTIRKIVYEEFLEYDVKIVELSHIVSVIKNIYEVLVKWSKDYENFRRRKYEVTNKRLDKIYILTVKVRYCSGI